MPIVSVVIPAYNCATYLPTAIESVLAQSFRDLELVVVDDGSTDNTPEVVAPYLNRIRYLRQPNAGVCAARNAGIRKTSGDLLALLDADDSWLPENLATQVPLFSDARIGMSYTDFSVRYDDGRILDSYLAERPLACEGDIIDNYLRSRFLFPSAMVLRRKAVEEAGLFDEELAAGEDLELFARIALRWKVARVPRALMRRIESTHNVTADGRKMSDGTILGFERILDREPALPPGTRRIVLEELGRQHWWRGYARLGAGEAASARQDLRKAMRYDSSYTRKALPLLLASWLPAAALRRLRSS